jgi:carnitine-CoA ligase
VVTQASTSTHADDSTTDGHDSIDARFPSGGTCVLERVLERQARQRGDEIFVAFDDGTTWTYGDAYLHACRAAAGLQSLGVEQGDSVLSWLPNGPDVLKVWFGANFLGALYCPINVAYRGRLLEHVVDNSGATVIVVHAELLDRLSDIDRGRLTTAVVTGEAGPLSLGLEVVSSSVLTDLGPTFQAPIVPVEPWDDYAIVYTSGTTGPSKGVLCTYIQLYEGVQAAYAGCGVNASDKYLLQVPMFHLGGIIGTYATAVIGGSLVMVPAFQTSSFWRVVRTHQVTVCSLLGAMATFLVNESPKPDDADNPLRLAYMVPLVPEVAEFEKRFGVEVRTMFSMTEVPPPLISEKGSFVPGSCGRLRPGIEARIVDPFDRELPPGEAGELVLRSDLPWSISHGYHRMPAATAQAWRNGWFHTGDVLRRDETGHYWFVDRLSDSIRRRGENISSLEIELEISAHPDVREVAAIAVPAEHGEDEIMVVVSPREDRNLEPLELLRFLIPRVAHFMVPRYVRIVDDLPKTPTAKVRKQILRIEGVTTDTFDRESSELVIRRDRIGERKPGENT